MDQEFRWIEWNVGKCELHGVDPFDVEHVVRHAVRPYPAKVAGEKFLVRGQSEYGIYLQVIFTFDADGTVFVIHARPLNDAEKHTLRRRRR
jgi:hypothetical protein